MKFGDFRRNFGQRSRGMRMTVAALLGSVPAILTVSGCILFFCR